MNFSTLANNIQKAHSTLHQSASKAVNLHLTLRNWLTGLSIVEYEQKGSDRAEYGKKLLEKLAKKIDIKGLTAPELSRCRQFYRVYPEVLYLNIQSDAKRAKNNEEKPFGIHHLIFGTLSQKFQNILPARIPGTVSQSFDAPGSWKLLRKLPVPRPAVYW